jgi:hypothetical protein
MPQPPLPIAYEPSPIHTWGYLDPRWVPNRGSDEYWQWKGRGEGSSINPRYGRGAVPILPGMSFPLFALLLIGSGAFLLGEQYILTSPS